MIDPLSFGILAPLSASVDQYCLTSEKTDIIIMIMVIKICVK